MITLFIPIVLFFVRTSHGQQNEVWNSSNYTLTDSNLQSNRPTIDLNNEKIKNTYNLLKSSYKEWLNEANDEINNITLKHNLFWKLAKLTAAYLRRGYNEEGDFFLNGDNADISEILDDEIIRDMLQYYEKMNAEKNYSKSDNTNLRNTFTEEIKYKFAQFWNKSLQKFKQWWENTKIPDFQVSNKLENVKKIGQSFKSFFIRSRPPANTSSPDSNEFIFRNRRLLYIERTTLRTYSYIDREYCRKVRKNYKEAERWLRFVNNWRKKRAKKAALARGETWPTPSTRTRPTKAIPLKVRLKKYLGAFV